MANNIILDNNVKEWVKNVTTVLERQGLYFEDSYFIERHCEA